MEKEFIKICQENNVVGAEVVTPDKQILVVTENGYGKKTNVEEQPLNSKENVKSSNIIKKKEPVTSFRGHFMNYSTGMRV